MKDIYAVGLGVAAFAAGCAVVAVSEADKVQKIDDKLTGFCKGMNYIQESIDLSVPEEVAEELTKKAAEKVALDQVKKATTDARAEIVSDIKAQVKTAVSNEYAKIAPELKDTLEKQINLQTIERIEQQAAAKVAKQILDKGGLVPQASSKESIIKTCAENGMSAYEIQKILEATN